MTDPLTENDRLQWHEAYGPCPCGCGHDGNALIDRETGSVTEWECNVTGKIFPAWSGREP